MATTRDVEIELPLYPEPQGVEQSRAQVEQWYRNSAQVIANGIGPALIRHVRYRLEETKVWLDGELQERKKKWLAIVTVFVPAPKGEGQAEEVK